MTAMKLLAAIRSRAAEQGLTLADLARAARMQPGNLRRMLANTAASPRLGSVMRLLPPLHCRVAPAGARVAAELVAHLDEQRRTRGCEWEQLLGQHGKRADRFAVLALSDADGLSLADVARVADALHVELSLVDDLEQTAGDGPGTHPRRSRRRAAQRERAAHQARLQETASPPVSQPGGPPPAASPPAPPPVSGTTDNSMHSLGPLRPPRLGRYRDAALEQRVVRTPTASWTPREPRPELADALLPRLAELSGDDWGDVYTFVWHVLSWGASLPQQFVDRLGKMTESSLARLRRPKSPTRPAVPEPPDGWYDLLDPDLLVRPWLASREPGYRSTDTPHHYDAHGIRIGHLALDRETMAAIRLAPHGAPHNLIDLIHLPRHGEPKSLLHTAVPLAVKLGDDRHLFRHVKAGPVFGEIAAGDRIYLLAAVSSLLVIVEVHGEHARIVWGGRAEKLPHAVIELPTPATATRTEEPVTTVAELERRLAETEALLAAERRAREDDQRHHEPRAGAAARSPKHLAGALRFIDELQAQLNAEIQGRFEAESKCLLAEARLKKVTLARDSLEAEIAALRSGTATNTADPEATVAELERRLAEAEALLTAERRAREEDRRSDETRGQESGQTKEQVENTLRYITELQTQLQAQTAERLEVEDKRLIAEDKRLLAEEQLKRVALARDKLAAEVVGAEQRTRHATDSSARLAQDLAVSQSQEQTSRDALTAAHQELEAIQRAQADEMSLIRELIAAKRFPEAVLHSLARSLGESDVEAVLDRIPPSDVDAMPPEIPAVDGPADPAPPLVTAPRVVACQGTGKRILLGTAKRILE